LSTVCPISRSTGHDLFITSSLLYFLCIF
jgi:hypothetical protein